MKNIFMDLLYFELIKIMSLTGKKKEYKLKSLAKKNSITLTKCTAMYRDIIRIYKCLDKIIKYSSKVW